MRRAFTGISYIIQKANIDWKFASTSDTTMYTGLSFVVIYLRKTQGEYEKLRC